MNLTKKQDTCVIWMLVLAVSLDSRSSDRALDEENRIYKFENATSSAFCQLEHGTAALQPKKMGISESMRTMLGDGEQDELFFRMFRDEWTMVNQWWFHEFSWWIVWSPCWTNTTSFSDSNHARQWHLRLVTSPRIKRRCDGGIWSTWWDCSWTHLCVKGITCLKHPISYRIVLYRIFSILCLSYHV